MRVLPKNWYCMEGEMLSIWRTVTRTRRSTYSYRYSLSEGRSECTVRDSTTNYFVQHNNRVELVSIFVRRCALLVPSHFGPTNVFRRRHSSLLGIAGIKMKSKELKNLRKRLANANRCDELLKGFDNDTVISLIIKDSGESDLPKGSSPIQRTNLCIVFSTSSHMTEERFEDCLHLFERNMGEMYKNSSWGLNMEEKSVELTDDKARFLLVLDDNEKLAAFVHFRFEYDDEETPTCGVLYIYEIQIESLYRRCGLGKKLMAMAERIACNQSMAKILLTVFKKNHQAMAFYTESLGYVVDDSSPSKFGDHNVDYEILSLKILLKQKVR